jgi:hypothetical protein
VKDTPSGKSKDNAWNYASHEDIFRHLIMHHTMKPYGGVEVQIHAFITSALRWELVFSFISQACYFLYPLDTGMGEPQEMTKI